MDSLLMKRNEQLSLCSPHRLPSAVRLLTGYGKEFGLCALKFRSILRKIFRNTAARMFLSWCRSFWREDESECEGRKSRKRAVIDDVLELPGNICVLYSIIRMWDALAVYDLNQQYWFRSEWKIAVRGEWIWVKHAFTDDQAYATSVSIYI